MPNCPKAIAEYAEFVRDSLGLQAWSLSIKIVEDPSVEDPSSDEREFLPADARIECNYDYVGARLYIAEDLVDRLDDTTTIDEIPAELRILICHELIHLLDTPLEHAYEQAINLFVKKTDDRKRAFYLVRSHVEHRVTRFAHQLYRMIEARRMLGYSDDEIDDYASGARMRPLDEEVESG